MLSDVQLLDGRAAHPDVREDEGEAQAATDDGAEAVTIEDLEPL